MFWIGGIDIVKMTILSKAVYRVKMLFQMHWQMTNGIFHRVRSKHFIMCIETQKTLSSQNKLEKKNGAGGAIP